MSFFLERLFMLTMTVFFVLIIIAVVVGCYVGEGKLGKYAEIKGRQGILVQTSWGGLRMCVNTRATSDEILESWNTLGDWTFEEWKKLNHRTGIWGWFWEVTFLPEKPTDY